MNNIEAPTEARAKPEWLRMPKPGHTCPVTGLSRAYLYRLATDGKIKTVSLRDRGKLRGVRLISYDSLLAYIEKAGAEEAK